MKMIGTEDVIGLLGVALIAGGLALERLSLCLLWLGLVAIGIAWGILKVTPRQSRGRRKEQ